MVMYDTDQLKLDLACSVRSFCLFLFPNGKYKNGEYCVGSLQGEPGNSLRICLRGEKAGIWKDFATGDSGNNLLDLLYKVRGYGFQQACEEASNWLLNPDRFKLPPRLLIRKSRCPVQKPDESLSQSVPQYPKFHVFKYLEQGTSTDHAALSKLLGVRPEAIELAVSDGVLRFFEHPHNGRCWTVLDKCGYVRQDRRLDGRLFVVNNHNIAKARTIGSPSWPIGLPTDKKMIVLVEGSSDLLAAYSLIYFENLSDKVTPVSILGAANTIHQEAIKLFEGKSILGFPDYDSAGINGMFRWSEQLKGTVNHFITFDYSDLCRSDGQRVKDLRDFLSVDVDQWEHESNVRSPLSASVPFFIPAC